MPSLETRGANSPVCPLHSERMFKGVLSGRYRCPRCDPKSPEERRLAAALEDIDRRRGLPPTQAELDRLLADSTAAANALEKALSAAPKGAPLKELPEYEAFTRAAREFREACERKAANL